MCVFLLKDKTREKC